MGGHGATHADIMVELISKKTSSPTLTQGLKISPNKTHIPVHHLNQFLFRSQNQIVAANAAYKDTTAY